MRFSQKEIKPKLTVQILLIEKFVNYLRAANVILT